MQTHIYATLFHLGNVISSETKDFNVEHTTSPFAMKPQYFNVNNKKKNMEIILVAFFVNNYKIHIDNTKSACIWRNTLASDLLALNFIFRLLLLLHFI